MWMRKSAVTQSHLQIVAPAVREAYALLEDFAAYQLSDVICLMLQRLEASGEYRAEVSDYYRTRKCCILPGQSCVYPRLMELAQLLSEENYALLLAEAELIVEERSLADDLYLKVAAMMEDDPLNE